MEAVIDTVRCRVERDHGVRLVSEVHIVGERKREVREETNE
jgi:UDP-N-acetylenolpyruvoylglucosamine reductase